jgi:hypothetical protein
LPCFEIRKTQISNPKSQNLKSEQTRVAVPAALLRLSIKSQRKSKRDSSLVFDVRAVLKRCDIDAKAFGQIESNTGSAVPDIA